MAVVLNDSALDGGGALNTINLLSRGDFVLTYAFLDRQTEAESEGGRGRSKLTEGNQKENLPFTL